MNSSASTSRPRWFVAGDLNGFFGLVVDNLSILGFIAMALVGIFGLPADVVYGRMFPGTALGVLVGNLIYTVMARRLAARTGRDDVTAMPLGLDAPTSIGMALLVLGPAFAGFKQAGMDEAAALLLNRTDCEYDSELNFDQLLLGGYFCHICLPYANGSAFRRRRQLHRRHCIDEPVAVGWEVNDRHTTII